MEEPFPISASGFYVVGLEARVPLRESSEAHTSPTLEADPQTARIPDLWKRLEQGDLAAQIPRRLAKGHPFCVRFDYGQSAYSVVLGYQVPSLEDVPHGLRGLYIPSGRYLVFPTASQQLAQTWEAIQRYFAQPGAPQRAFTYEYEEHFCPSAPCDEVRIYIALA
ncbi:MULTISPECIES: GyrI-like domain-containing protein [unclassified Meiothermus]|uniref:GyrI-like domain-containing protein n=1 Tax=unclassified Meiothermus TaxID=370471 RepID=UPI000D7BDF15|nr:MULTISPECIES: GyrI-like domain-containing protein [unclassified Meiothermus]PZA06403.1 AraC family transcriptional regulator [Meiothermus sp. Pnk-1]RYM36978.1 AraC family transcriptional regulator [Meiothermus sp. PNK-Is4]